MRYTLLAMFLFAGALFQFFAWKISIRSDLVTVLYLLYVVVAALSVCWSVNKAEAVFSAGRTLLGFGVFVTALSLAKEWKLFTLAILYTNIIMAATFLFFFLWQVSEADIADRNTLYYVSGLHGHKNLFCSIMFLNLGFLLIARPAQGITKYVAFILCACLLITIGLLQSRGTILGLAATAIVYGLLGYVSRFTFRQKHVMLLIIGIIAAANVFYLWALPATVRMLTEQVSPGDLADEERLFLWLKSFQLFSEHPALGTGAGNWQILFPSAGLAGIWRADELNFTFQRPHNDLLWILTETGILGFNLFIGVLIIIVCYALANKAVEAEAGKRNKLLRAIAFLCGFLVIASFDFPLERIEHVLWFNVLLAFIYRSPYAQDTLPAFIIRGRTPVFIFGILLFLLAAVCGSMRLHGEYHTRQLYFDRYMSRPEGVVDAARRAESFFYTIDPMSVPLAWYSGTARILLGDAEGALRDFQKAHRYHPFNRHVLNDLASAYAVRGDNKKAREFYVKAAELSPRFDEPKLNLIAILIRERDFEEASKWLNSLMHDSERRAQYKAIVEAELAGKR